MSSSPRNPNARKGTCAVVARGKSERLGEVGWVSKEWNWATNRIGIRFVNQDRTSYFHPKNIDFKESLPLAITTHPAFEAWATKENLTNYLAKGKVYIDSVRLEVEPNRMVVENVPLKQEAEPEPVYSTMRTTSTQDRNEDTQPAARNTKNIEEQISQLTNIMEQMVIRLERLEKRANQNTRNSTDPFGDENDSVTNYNSNN